MAARILLISDVPVEANALAAFLEMRGYEVALFDRVVSTRPERLGGWSDLAIVGVRQNVPSVCSEVRARVSDKEFPIIALVDGFEERSVQDANQIIIRPFQLAQIDAAIGHLLQSQGSRIPFEG